jgi:hypothetical protein
MLALTAPRAYVSPKSYIDKDVKMLNSTKSKIALIGAAALALASDASAALTAAQVDMAPAVADITTVVVVIIGVLVVAFGFRKVMGFFGGK